MDYVFGFPKDAHGNNGILVFVDRFSKMVHLVAVPESITAEGCARVFIDTIFRLHDYPVNLCPIGTPGSRLHFGAPCSKHLEHGSQCLLLTILRLMVRLNAPIASSKRSFEGTSTRLRVGVSFCRWSSSPSTTPCMLPRHIHRST